MKRGLVRTVAVWAALALVALPAAAGAVVGHMATEGKQTRVNGGHVAQEAPLPSPSRVTTGGESAVVRLVNGQELRFEPRSSAQIVIDGGRIEIAVRAGEISFRRPSGELLRAGTNSSFSVPLDSGKAFSTGRPIDGVAPEPERDRGDEFVPRGDRPSAPLAIDEVD